jgi:sulfur relay (sulfurtransferase) complex TusBCD TusD component (DsrE family)
MAAVSLIESVMKFAIALFSAAHAPSSRRALLFAQAALAGGHEIVRLFFYQDGVYNASDAWSPRRTNWTCPNSGVRSSPSTNWTAWCASPPPCAVAC